MEGFSKKSSGSLVGDFGTKNTEWNHGTNSNDQNRRHCKMEFNHQKENSNEDTEDASEDGSTNDRNATHAMKEQMYFHKLELLKARLEELEYGRHPAFVKGLAKIEQERAERLRDIGAWREHESGCIEQEFVNETNMALHEFLEKKTELKNRLINEWEEKKRQIEQDRYSIELSMDDLEMKPIPRKLRRRPNDPPTPIPAEIKRRKSPQAARFTYLLDESMVKEDLDAISLENGDYSWRDPEPNDNSGNATAVETAQPLAPEAAATFLDSRIEDGKLFYEKKWFHRGQTVFVEGLDIPTKISGVICSISQDAIWIRKVVDQSKLRVMLTQLTSGDCAIKRRA